MDREKLISLVQKVQGGDAEAMDALFSAYYNDVYYFALKTVKDPDIACDITQETFLEIIRTIGNLKEPAAFVTWMKQITYHQCTRHFNKKTDILVDEDEDGNSIFDTLADEREGSIPSEVVEQEEFRRTILDMIDSLTEEQRAAVILYYFDELSVGQIAAIQGVSEGTVKSRLNYARKALKKTVESYEKKHNIKLHSFSFLPLFLLFFGKEAMPAAKATAIRTTVLSAAKAATVGAAATTAGTASAAAATGGVMAKVAAIPLVGKIIAGVVAAAMTVGTVALVIPEAEAPVPPETVLEESVPEESTPEESLPEDTAPQSPDGFQYENDFLSIYKPSLEYKDIFEEYVDGCPEFIRTNDGRILAADGTEMFRSEDGYMPEFFVVDHKLAYFDANGVFHGYGFEQWYACPGLEGRPVGYWFFTSSYSGSSESTTTIVVLSILEDGSYRCSGCDSNGNGKSRVVNFKVENADDVLPCITDSFYWDRGAAAAEDVFLADGQLCLSTWIKSGIGIDIYHDDDSYFVLQSTGVYPQKLFDCGKYNYARLLYLGQENSTIYALESDLSTRSIPLPKEQTTSNITQVIYSGYDCHLIIFDDGSVYILQPESNTLSLHEGLTDLNREGHIKAFMSPGNLLMDDNLTYILNQNYLPSAAENATN